MALSNWDTLAVNHEGKSIGGSVKFDIGVEVEFYKNWLYVHDKVAWQPGGSYMGDTIMEIHSGSLCYKGIQILAVRGPKEAIYAAVWDDAYNHPVKGMLGVALYGYHIGAPDDMWVGVEPEDVERLKATFNLWLVDAFPIPPSELLAGLSKGLRYNQGDAYLSGPFGVDVPATKPGDAQRPWIS